MKCVDDNILSSENANLTKDEICCVIVSYNPEDVLLRLVKSIENQVDKVIVVDNKSEAGGLETISKISEEVLVIYNSKNYGIARALNQGVLEAINLGYKWVITFDQDSEPFDNLIKIISEVYLAYPQKNKIGAIGVRFTSHVSNVNDMVTNGKNYRLKDYLITSGCLISTQQFVETGGFREDFFIDNVDIEYSLRLRKNGRACLISNEIAMFHKAGAPKTKKLFGFVFKSSNHNTTRRYYMARNHVILSKEYFFLNPYFIAKMNFFFFRSILLLLLVDDDKKAKLFASLKGFIDGVFYSSKRKKLSA